MANEKLNRLEKIVNGVCPECGDTLVYHCGEKTWCESCEDRVAESLVDSIKLLIQAIREQKKIMNEVIGQYKLWGLYDHLKSSKDDSPVDSIEMGNRKVDKILEGLDG